MVLVLTIWFGFLIARRLIAPLTQLSAEVAHAEPDQLPTDMAGRYYPDEVGNLARAFEGAMTRINQFIAREQRFTRDASHELRTPVTVIRGAAELIQKQLQHGQSPAAPLRRIQRAVRDMENIIETFLYLGREGSQSVAKGEAQVDVVVENLVEANRYLIEEKPVTARLAIHSRFRVGAPEPVVAITIGNILRNAFQYTDQGEVVLQVLPGKVVVRDSGAGLSRHQLTLLKERNVRGDQSRGFGLGLSIVHDFCQRHGWRFEIVSEPGQGTEVTLAFEEGDAIPASTGAGVGGIDGDGEV
nr:HAMP domain-containing sensor histidine kinase [Acanthopleuribacter pedis]